MTKWKLFQECKIVFNIWKSIKVIHHINITKEESHMTISINVKKVSKKNQHLFMTKTLIKLEIEGSFLHLIKDLYARPAANTRYMVKGWRYSSIRNKSKCTLSSLLFKVVRELYNTIWPHLLSVSLFFLSCLL